MDPQLAMIMANMAQVKNGDFIVDPFVGTGKPESSFLKRNWTM